MSWLDRRRQYKAERAVQRRAQAEAAELAAWQTEDDQLREFLDEARTFHGVDDGHGLMLKRDERTFQVLEGPSLIEPRRLPGHWEGRSQGFSIPVTSGVRYRIGSTKGHYIQGDETPTPIGTGTVTITNQRVVFQGTKATLEWAFPKVLGVQHVDNPKWPWTAIQMSNRQKTSGFTYPAQLAAPVRFRLDLALANFHGEVDDFIARIEEQVAEHGRERPSTALPAPATADPPSTDTAIARLPPPPSGGWMPDPTGRHEGRYWDGSRWTEHVMDGDTPAVPQSRMSRTGMFTRRCCATRPGLLGLGWPESRVSRRHRTVAASEPQPSSTRGGSALRERPDEGPAMEQAAN